LISSPRWASLLQSHLCSLSSCKCFTCINAHYFHILHFYLHVFGFTSSTLSFVYPQVVHSPF
jgi:hypothetical protein